MTCRFAVDNISPQGLPWNLVRRSPRVADSLLLNDTKAWVASLPQSLRPLHLASDYPRVANELVQVWDNTFAARKLLDELLFDKRAGRKGFPPQVRADLERLMEAVTARADVWDLAVD